MRPFTRFHFHLSGDASSGSECACCVQGLNGCVDRLLGRLERRALRLDRIVAALKAEGLGATEIAKRLKVGRASVYRLLASRADASPLR